MSDFLYQLFVHSPIVAILIIFIILQRRDFKRAMADLQESYAKLEDALIRLMDRM